MESPTIILEHRKSSRFSKATTRSSNYSADMTERIRAAFQPHPSPSGPLPFLGLEASDNIRPIGSGIASTAVSRRSSNSSHRNRSSNASSSSEDNSPLAQVNLRVGSMTVSKWLTFGHVLFSDVRHELSLDVPDGQHLRQGSWIGVPVPGIHKDERFYHEPEVYDPFRFVPSDLSNASSSKGKFVHAEGHKPALLTTTSDTYLPFGYARHSW